jgi:hypothetical protein
MPLIKKLVLDVLKPHDPGVIEFSQNIASKGPDYRVILNVVEMDEKTETLELIVEGSDVNIELIVDAINEMGGSLHSIDCVEVFNKKA